MISQWETPSPSFMQTSEKTEDISILCVYFFYIFLRILRGALTNKGDSVCISSGTFFRSSNYNIFCIRFFVNYFFYKNVYNFYVCLSITHNWNELSGWNLLHLVGVLHRSVSIEKFFHRLHCVLSGRLSTNSSLEAMWNWSFFYKIASGSAHRVLLYIGWSLKADLTRVVSL